MPSNPSTTSAVAQLTNPAIGEEVTERTFHLFINLPIELQLLIWRHSFPEEGRVIEIVWTGRWWSPLESAAPANAMLSVCKQSREEYQKHYKHLCHLAPTDYYQKLTGLGVQLDHCSSSNIDMSNFPKCFFNPDMDTLYFSFFSLGDIASDIDASMFFDPTVLNSLSRNKFFPQPKVIAVDGCEVLEWIKLPKTKSAYPDLEAGLGKAIDQKDFLKIVKTIFPRLETVIIVMIDVYWTQILQDSLFKPNGEVTWGAVTYGALHWYGSGEGAVVGGGIREIGKVVTAYGVDLVWQGILRGGKSLHDLEPMYSR